MISTQLLEILACPSCKKDVIEKDNTIICTECNRVYPIRNGIPVMLIEDTIKVSDNH